MEHTPICNKRSAECPFTPKMLSSDNENVPEEYHSLKTNVPSSVISEIREIENAQKMWIEKLNSQKTPDDIQLRQIEWISKFQMSQEFRDTKIGILDVESTSGTSATDSRRRDVCIYRPSTRISTRIYDATSDESKSSKVMKVAKLKEPDMESFKSAQHRNFDCGKDSSEAPDVKDVLNGEGVLRQSFITLRKRLGKQRKKVKELKLKDEVESPCKSDVSPAQREMDRKAARDYMQKKREEREEKMGEARKKKQREEEEKRANLEKIKEKQLKIIQHSKRRHSNIDKPGWIGPFEQEFSKKKPTPGTMVRPPVLTATSPHVTGAIPFASSRKPDSSGGLHQWEPEDTAKRDPSEVGSSHIPLRQISSDRSSQARSQGSKENLPVSSATDEIASQTNSSTKKEQSLSLLTDPLSTSSISNAKLVVNRSPQCYSEPGLKSPISEEYVLSRRSSGKANAYKMKLSSAINENIKSLSTTSQRRKKSFHVENEEVKPLISSCKSSDILSSLHDFSKYPIQRQSTDDFNNRRSIADKIKENVVKVPEKDMSELFDEGVKNDISFEPLFSERITPEIKVSEGVRDRSGGGVESDDLQMEDLRLSLPPSLSDRLGSLSAVSDAVQDSSCRSVFQTQTDYVALQRPKLILETLMGRASDPVLYGRANTKASTQSLVREETTLTRNSRSDTTISDSLSVDPLKVPDSVRSLALVPTCRVEGGFPGRSRSEPRLRCMSEVGSHTDSDHSSGHLSQVVKVSRTISRGSTVLSEVSERHTVSSVPSLKFNTSLMHSRIQEELNRLESFNQSITTVLEKNKIVLSHTKSLAEATDHKEHSPSIKASQISSQALSGYRDTTLSSIAEVVSADLSTLSSHSITKYSLHMLSELIKDEAIRSNHQTSIFKMREKALIDRTKAEIAYLELEKKKFKEKGKDDAVKNIRKKIRGLIIRLQEDLEKLHRQRKHEREASKKRRLVLLEKINSIKAQIALRQQKSSPSKSIKDSSKSLPSTSSDRKKVTPCPEKKVWDWQNLEQQKRDLEEREAALAARRKKLEQMAAWRKRVEEEEKKLRDLETLISSTTASASTTTTQPYRMDRGTSPLQLSSADSQDEEPPNQNDLAGSQNKGSSCEGLGSGDAPKMAAIKVPLSPRLSTKRRHSSGSDESVLLSQNETQSEASDMESRVLALQQQLKQRKAELDSLRREYKKSQRERLIAKERSLLTQIQAYDTYIEQVKNELEKEAETKVVKPLIKQPKLCCDRRKSDTWLLQEKIRTNLEGASSKSSTKLDSEFGSTEGNKSHISEVRSEKKLDSSMEFEPNSRKEDTSCLSFSNDKSSVHENNVVSLNGSRKSQTKDSTSVDEIEPLSIQEKLNTLIVADSIENNKLCAKAEGTNNRTISYESDEGAGNNEPSELAENIEDKKTSGSSCSEATNTDEVISAAARILCKTPNKCYSSKTEVGLADRSIFSPVINENNYKSNEMRSIEIVSNEISHMVATNDMIESIKFDTFPGSDPKLDIKDNSSSTSQSVTSVVSSSKSEIVGDIGRAISQNSANTDTAEVVETDAISSESMHHTESEVRSIVMELDDKVESSVGGSLSSLRRPSVELCSQDTHNKSTVLEMLEIQPSENSSVVESVITSIQRKHLDVQNISEEISATSSEEGGSIVISVEEVLEDKTEDSQEDNENQRLSKNASESEDLVSATMENIEENISEMSVSTSHYVANQSKSMVDVNSENEVSNDAMNSISEAIEDREISGEHESRSKTASISELLTGEKHANDRSSYESGSNLKFIKDTHDSEKIGDLETSVSVMESVSEVMSNREESVKDNRDFESSSKRVSDLGLLEEEGSVSYKSKSKSELVAKENVPNESSKTHEISITEVIEGSRECSTLIRTELDSLPKKRDEDNCTKSEDETTVSSTSKEMEEIIGTDVESERNTWSEVNNATSNNSGSFGSYVSESGKETTDPGSPADEESPSPQYETETEGDVREPATNSDSTVVEETQVQSLEEEEDESKSDEENDVYNDSLNGTRIVGLDDSALNESFDGECQLMKLELTGRLFEEKEDEGEEGLEVESEESDSLLEGPLNEVYEMLGDGGEVGAPLIAALQREGSSSLWRSLAENAVQEATDLILAIYNNKVQIGEKVDGHEMLDRKKVGENGESAPWVGGRLLLDKAREAELLRLQQIQIDKEISELEEEEARFYYVRQIPDKPPPPYTPRRADLVAAVVEAASHIWDTRPASPPASFLPGSHLREFLWDLAGELVQEMLPQEPSSCPPWIQHRRRRPRKLIRRKEELLEVVEKEAKVLLGVEQRQIRENLISRWSKKKRDEVDEVLVREGQEEEWEWTDFTEEESAIKNSIAESVVEGAVSSAVEAIASAFLAKFRLSL